MSVNLFPVVSECCPVGCATPVFLVLSQKDGLLYSYCWSCNALWSHPLEVSSGELNEVLEANHQPQGFRIPADAEIIAAGFDKFVLYRTADEHCRHYFEAELSPFSSQQQV